MIPEVALCPASKGHQSDTVEVVGKGNFGKAKDMITHPGTSRAINALTRLSSGQPLSKGRALTKEGKEASSQVCATGSRMEIATTLHAATLMHARDVAARPMEARNAPAAD